MSLRNVRRPSSYEGLMEELVEALGIDLDQLMASGEISAETVGRMMNHCSVCGGTAECRKLLVAKSVDITEPPSYCANIKLLKYLQSLADQNRDR